MKRILYKFIRLNLNVFQNYIDKILKKTEINISLSFKKLEDLIYEFNEEKQEFFYKKGIIKIDNRNILITILNQEIALYTNFNKKHVCYWSYLNEKDKNNINYDFTSCNFKTIKGSDCYRIMQQYNKIPKINSYHGTKIENVNQIFYKNSRFFYRKIKNCICYDVNSAFSFVQLNYYIDFNDLGSGVVLADEIGFNPRYEEFSQLDLETTYLPVEKDFVALHRFKKKDVPQGIIKFVNKYYNQKKLESKSFKEHKAKSILNFSIGEANNHNWAYRTLIIALSNLRIYKYIKMIQELYGDVVLYANTDCIATTCRISFLDNMLGHNIGEFKIEKTGTLYMNDEAYQWNNSKPVYSGIPKFKFDRFQEEYHKAFDLSKDDELIKLKGFLSNQTKYMLDLEDLKIKPFNLEKDKENNKILFGLKPYKYKIVGDMYGKDTG